MISGDDENNEPSWLDTENDQIHRKDVEPLLFGTGNLALSDPNEDDAEIQYGDSDDNSGAGKQKSPKAENKQSGTVTTPKSSFWTLPSPATSLLGKAEDSNDDVFGSMDKTYGSKYEGDDDEDGVMNKDTFHEKSGRPREPSRHWIVRFFFAIQTFGMITNLALLISQILPIIFVPVTTIDTSYLALKIYLCAFSIIFLIVEFDHPSIKFFRKASFLRSFASRGFLYTFLGLVCFDEANSEAAYEALEGKNKDLAAVLEVSWFALANVIAAWSLIGLGVLYFLMGIVCLQKVRNRYVYDDRKKWEAHQEALEKWNEEV